MVFYIRRKIRLKYILIVVSMIGIIYTIYQIRSVQELTSKSLKQLVKVRGVHISHSRFYIPKENNKFACISGNKLLDFNKVNDDYCDCEDGSDEPGTEACPNGKFYCAYEINQRNAKSIPSGRVNDGICDCCDGSDEWKKIRLPFASPCRNVC